MEKKDIVDQFVLSRPDAVGVFGYGSGVFKQESYSDLDKPQIDLIFIVDDLRKWHVENIKLNNGDYSIIGKIYFNLNSLKKIKGFNKITYVSNVKFKDYKFKYGVVELSDFIKSLKTWNNFFIAGRFQKPTMKIKGNYLIDNALNSNIESALLVGCLLCDAETDFIRLYELICGLSYLGDIRMSFAENPNKVQNIVKGSISNFVRMYLIDLPFIKFNTNCSVIINHKYILEHIDLLPLDLLSYLMDVKTDLSNLEEVRNNIYKYFRIKNREESFHQILDGLKTNGVVKSVPYALAKINKRFSIK